MATIQEINSSIMFGDLTNDELNAVIDAVKFARANLAKQVKYTLVKGSRAKFRNSRTGQIMIGEITEVKRKFIHLRVGQSTWRVPANMLEAA
jgi:hypothetical protein